MRPASRVSTILLLGGLAALFAGCSGYAIRGRVISGELSHAAFTSPDDPVLASGDGVDDAVILLYRDPDRLNRALVAQATVSADGSFVLPVDSFGAGWMEEAWEIVARAPGRQPAQTIVALPGSPKNAALLVVLASGRDRPDPSNPDLLEEYERYK